MGCPYSGVCPRQESRCIGRWCLGLPPMDTPQVRSALKYFCLIRRLLYQFQ